MSTKITTAYMKAKHTITKYGSNPTPRQAKRIRLRVHAALGENPTAVRKNGLMNYYL